MDARKRGRRGSRDSTRGQSIPKGARLGNQQVWKGRRRALPLVVDFPWQGPRLGKAREARMGLYQWIIKNCASGLSSQGSNGL